MSTFLQVLLPKALKALHSLCYWHTLAPLDEHHLPTLITGQGKQAERTARTGMRTQNHQQLLCRSPPGLSASLFTVQPFVQMEQIMAEKTYPHLTPTLS